MKAITHTQIERELRRMARGDVSVLFGRKVQCCKTGLEWTVDGGEAKALLPAIDEMMRNKKVA
jgi:hypothetical protein